MPTDTVYGLAALPTDEAAVDRLFELKMRPRQMHLPIMVANKKDLVALGVQMTDAADKLLQSPYMPGALTIVLGFKDDNRLPWLKGRDEIAIRIPDDARLLAVLEKTGPLLVTSANRHGWGDIPTKVPEILEELDGEPDLVLDEGDVKVVPSTIINCRITPPVIERVGRIAEQELFDFLATP